MIAVKDGGQDFRSINCLPILADFSGFLILSAYDSFFSIAANA